MVLVLVLVCAGSAEQTPGADNQAKNPWNGTWESVNYTFSIQQNGQEIVGTYIPGDPNRYDTGILKGNVSEDLRTFSGMWTESGSIELTLSEDGLSFKGTVTNDPVGEMTEPFTFERTGTRVGTPVDPDNLWTGTWKTPKKMYYLTQDGTSITGRNEALPGINDEPGIYEGTVSGDGKTTSIRWIESGNFTFILSDDGLSWNGTYSEVLDPSAELYPWNATRIQ